ncbi:cytochrome P450 family protein [Ceratobasidium sp. AG-Ba]|nr:cytochrome P450 family protein [Ceratobasidium sp. AG-Ba]
MEGYTQVCFEDPNCPATFIADPEAIKEMTRPKAPFIQDSKAVQKLFGTYGPSLVILEGDEWKRHRRITQKAFSEENAKLVWSESVLVIEKLFEKWDSQYGREVYVPQITMITEALALMVISSAALGQRMSWDDLNKKTPPGYTVSFQQAITIVARTVLTRALTPSWTEGWSEATRTMATGFREFGRYMQDMATTYRRKGTLDQDLTGTEVLAQTPTDTLFEIIMAASEGETPEDSKAFTDREAMGNIFLFLMAGHETTAHALAFSLGLLALHPEVQNEVYAQIKQTLGSRQRLEYSDLNDLKLATGTLLESLRMYPVALRIAKLVAEDSVLTVARNGPGTGESMREKIFLPAGSRAVIAVTAVHYNPRYWPEPEEFQPTRFTDSYNRDAFLAFGVGRRACVGRKFAETEGAAVLATILSKYEILVDHTKFQTIPGESLQARRERLLRPNYHITIAPENLPLVFKRRA